MDRYLVPFAESAANPAMIQDPQSKSQLTWRTIGPIEHDRPRAAGAPALGRHTRMTMPVQITEQTVARALAGNPTIESAIESIINELREAQAALTEVRPARAELKSTLDDWLARLEAVKGRPAYYPYIGSGLGHGPLVELADGSVKWDLINGIGVHMFGHSDPELVRTTLFAALGDTTMQGNLQFNQDSIEFSEFLIGEASKNSRLAHVFLSNSGAMVNEAALKVCMQKKDGKAPRIIAFDDCFMGRTIAMSQIGDSPAHRIGLPLNTMVDYMPFYDPTTGDRSIEYARRRLQQHLKRYPDQHACFVMELVQGEGGFNLAPREFFIALMELCREHAIPVWIDEVQTFGRTTEMFYYDVLELGEYIDVLTLGKMSQVCACLYTRDMNPKPGLLSGTFIGSTVGLQVGLAMLRRLRDGGYYGASGKIARLQERFCAKMRDLVTRRPAWFPQVHPSRANGPPITEAYGGTGGMMRFTPFGGEKDRIIAACRTLFEEGVIAFYCGHDPYHVRFLPPVGVFEPEHFEPVFDIVERGLEMVAD